MTRDEAIKIQKRHVPTNIVDILADLGMLKLDEPKKHPNERAVDALFERGIGGMITPRHAMEAIDAAGLRIVEK